jgi:hypothetical protein
VKAKWAFGLVLVAFKALVLTWPICIPEMSRYPDDPLLAGEHFAKRRAPSYLSSHHHHHHQAEEPPEDGRARGRRPAIGGEAGSGRRDGVHHARGEGSAELGVDGGGAAPRVRLLQAGLPRHPLHNGDLQPRRRRDPRPAPRQHLPLTNTSKPF